MTVYNQVCNTRKKQRKLKRLQRQRNLERIAFDFIVCVKPFNDAFEKVKIAFKNLGCWIYTNYTKPIIDFFTIKPVKTRLIKPYLGNQGNPYFYKTILIINLG
jgi:hypothetical protein